MSKKKQQTLREHPCFTEATREGGFDLPERLQRGHAERAVGSDTERRTMDFVVSTHERDRHNSEVVGKWDLTPYKRNPAVQFAHIYSAPSVARALRVGMDPMGRLVSRAEFVPEEILEFAGTLWRMYEGDWMRGVSAGFTVKRQSWIEHKEKEAGKTGRMGHWELAEPQLLEYSLVPIGSNPSALTKAITRGICSENYEDAFIGNKLRDLTAFGDVPFEDARRIVDEYMDNRFVDEEVELVESWKYDDNVQCGVCGTDDPEAHAFDCEESCTDHGKRDPNEPCGVKAKTDSTKTTIDMKIKGMDETEKTALAFTGLYRAYAAGEAFEVPEGVNPDVLITMLNPDNKIRYIEKVETEDDEWEIRFTATEAVEIKIENEDDDDDLSDERGVIRYQKWPLASEKSVWFWPAEKRKSEVEDLIIMTVWFKDDGDECADYRLPHHRVSDYYVVWDGVRAAMGALLGARGGARLPREVREDCFEHISKHYVQFEKDVPEFRDAMGADISFEEWDELTYNTIGTGQSNRVERDEDNVITRVITLDEESGERVAECTIRYGELDIIDDVEVSNEDDERATVTANLASRFYGTLVEIGKAVDLPFDPVNCERWLRDFTIRLDVQGNPEEKQAVLKTERTVAALQQCATNIASIIDDVSKASDGDDGDDDGKDKKRKAASDDDVDDEDEAIKAAERVLNILQGKAADEAFSHRNGADDAQDQRMAEALDVAGRLASLVGKGDDSDSDQP